VEWTKAGVEENRNCINRLNITGTRRESKLFQRNLFCFTILKVPTGGAGTQLSTHFPADVPRVVGCIKHGRGCSFKSQSIYMDSDLIYNILLHVWNLEETLLWKRRRPLPRK
jgi:hypothetical protein